jgi:hypothetical protein
VSLGFTPSLVVAGGVTGGVTGGAAATPVSTVSQSAVGLSVGSAVTSVDTGPAVRGLDRAVAALERVVPGPSDEGVGCRAAVQAVVALRAEKEVGPRSTVEGVVAGRAGSHARRPRRCDPDEVCELEARRARA